MASVPVTVFHNPACSKSRAVVEALNAAGHSPTVIDFIRTGWTREMLADLLAAMSAHPRDILRNDPVGQTLGVTEETPEDAVFDAMIAHPALVNRPIVRTSAGAVLARPPELAFDLIARTAKASA